MHISDSHSIILYISPNIIIPEIFYLFFWENAEFLATDIWVYVS